MEEIFAPGVVQIWDDFRVLVSFLHQGWCKILAKVVQILTPNNNNLIKTTTTMLGYQNWTWVSPILIPEHYQCCCFFLNLREERKKVQGTR